MKTPGGSSEKDAPVLDGETLWAAKLRLSANFFASTMGLGLLIRRSKFCSVLNALTSILL